MTFSNIDRWLDIFGFDPTGVPSNDLKRKIASCLREMCSDLNLRADRRDITQALRRLEQAGKLLEDHRWLQGEL